MAGVRKSEMSDNSTQCVLFYFNHTYIIVTEYLFVVAHIKRFMFDMTALHRRETVSCVWTQ